MNFLPVPNKRIFVERNQRTSEAIPLLAVSQRHGVLPKRELEALDGRSLSAENLDLSNYKVARAGDLVYNKMRMWQGAVGVAPCDGIVSPAYVVATPREPVDLRYFIYLFKSEWYQLESRKESAGLCDDMNNLPWSAFSAMKSHVPDYLGQIFVADYLDRQTAAIDALIAKKEELLGVLDRYRQAVITKAVTKGLNPDVELVDSGVEWLGTVPKHWELKKSRQVLIRAKELNAGMRCANRLSLTLGGVLPRSLEDANGLQASNYETYQIVKEDDLIFKLIDLENVNTSRVGLVPEEGIVSPVYIRLSSRGAAVLPKFGYYWFYSMYLLQIFNKMGAGVRQAMSADELLSIRIALPPPDEQLQIVEALDGRLQSLKLLREKTELVIARLKRYRASVISAAVTGNCVIASDSEAS